MAVTLILVAVLVIAVSSFLWEEREPELKVGMYRLDEDSDGEYNLLHTYIR